MTYRSIQTLLIANRGEIALRIMRTARHLGVRTIAVYSDADRDSPHVRAADSAVHIGASPPADSYLNIPALLDAAARSGADAVHPGYGFLAENADFAQAIVDAGLVFVGPSPAAIRAMAHKAGAKRLLAAAGVPCVPGYNGEDQDDATMTEQAARIGFPVMIKASAGGGGRGMRRVEDARDFAATLRSARSEAEHAFGSGELILERAIADPRHVEIQVFADARGNVVHLGERDCSVQRRHQKLIEESPSPAVTADLRARIGKVAVAAARAIDYRGAGTLEFLLDRDGQFYFMEMNTRLQVEHAVTEAVTGVDLVEWQLRVAGGESLPLDQEQIDARLAAGGHAIEARLCAEDPARDFLPQSGTVALWRAPAGLRTDHALHDGGSVSPFYDSMLAKIVARGSTRADALRSLGAALDDCVLLGLTSNRRFLSRCLAHPKFVAGLANTGFIDAYFPAAGREVEAASPRLVAVAAGLLLSQRSRSVARRYPQELAGWSSNGVHAQGCRFALDDASFDVGAALVERCAWVIGDARTCIRIDEVDVHRSLIEIDGVGHALTHANARGKTYFVFDGVEHVVIDLSHAPAAQRREGARSGSIAAPINGRIVAFDAVPNSAVRAGQVLLVIEAMKMEHSVLAPIDGRIASVFAAIGDQVAPGRALLEIEPTQ